MDFCFIKWSLIWNCSADFLWTQLQKTVFCQVNQLNYNHWKIANYISTCQIANRKSCVLLIHAKSSAIMSGYCECFLNGILTQVSVISLSVDWLGSLLQCQREVFAKFIIHLMKIVSMTGSKKLFSALLNNSNDLWFIIVPTAQMKETSVRTTVILYATKANILVVSVTKVYLYLILTISSKIKKYYQYCT